MALQVNLNSASIDVLAKLPGIGPGLAERVVEYRDRVGHFRNVEELVAVAGISDRMIDRFRARVNAAANDEAPARTELPPLPVRVILRNAAHAPYAGHQINASFVRRQALSSSAGSSSVLWVPTSITQGVPGSGDVTLQFPNRADLKGDVVLRVRAPDGEVLHEASVGSEKMPEKLELNVEPRRYEETTPNDDPDAGKPARLKGRVIDESGRAQVARTQVVIWGAQMVDPVDVNFRALIVVQTDANGYFSGPYPGGQFSAAHGAVALGDGEPMSVPIHLQDDGRFPQSLILVVDLDEVPKPPQEEDCGCHAVSEVPRDPDVADLSRADGTYSSDPGAGRCVDFTKPDRTLEEFSYSYVVRTTEPTIKGLTLREPAKIDVSHLIGLLPQTATMATRMVDGGNVAGNAADDATKGFSALAGGKTAFATDRLDAGILQTLARDPDGFSLTKVATAAELTVHGDLLRVIGQHLGRVPGRQPLTCGNPVDWDHEPTIYQACTVAHGHVLRFKQEWVADGYSMGNLLYSLPLAPGQKKQIAVVDWERRESSSRSESIDTREELDAAISRDRDINEIVNATVNESVRGGSKASSSSIAGGIGVGAILGPVGGLLGVGGGTSSASGSSWQNSSRSTAASALNQLRDRTIQSASALRSQRSTVVQTTRQGERIVATTETVANYNHCHAITIQYFEVLRHLLVRQRLTDVQECLFVPLLMSRFDSSKAMRWRNTLRPAVFNRRLRSGFDALERVKANYVGSDFPDGSYADQLLEHVDGDLSLRFEIARPRDDNDDFDPNTWSFLTKLFPSLSAADFYKQFLKGQALKDRIFQEQLAPKIAERFVQQLQFFAVDQANTRTRIPIDTTLVSDFANDRPLYVSLRLAANLPPLIRKSIKYIEVSDISGVLNLPFLQILPSGSKVLVQSGSLQYRTKYSSGHLFRDARILNDLIGGDSARIYTPLSREELRNPKEEDKELVRNLLDHLNEHIEHFHHCLWRAMNDSKRYMLLDGFEAPNANGRSVASVVENELIGIIGNCLIMPVARGFHLDPTFRQDIENPVDLLEHYQPNTPIEPSRVAVPTRGVYAEAVMGACNSCERKEEERFWRWEESPLPDQPPPILPVSTDSRRSDAPDLAARDYPAPIIAMQNAPAAPDPTGLAAAMQLLGTPNLFRDAAGLDGTQKNAAAASQSAFDTAQFFGGKAADLALQAKMSRDIDKAVKTIASAKQSGLTTDAQAQELTKNAISGMIGGGAEEKPKPISTSEEVKKIVDTAGANRADVSVTRPSGEKVEARTMPQVVGAPAAWVDLDANTASARTFAPDKNDKGGRMRLQAAVSNAPPGAKFQWTGSGPDSIRFATANAGSTDVLAGKSGVTTVSFEVQDSTGNSLRIAHAWVGVPKFIVVREFTGPAYASHRPGVADSHRLDTVLGEFHLAAHKVAVLQTARLVCDLLMRKANVRTIWQIAPFAEALPAQFTPGQFAESFVSTLDIGGFTPTTRFGSSRPAAQIGMTHTTRAGAMLPTDGLIEIYPGAIDSGAFPEVAPILAAVIRLESAVAADTGNAALARTLSDVQDVWTEVVGRMLGMTIAHEIHHLLLADAPGLTSGHTTAPDIDLLSPGTSVTFAQWTGIVPAAPLPANFPAPGTFVDRGFNGLLALGEANQARVDALFPVPPAFPF